MKQLLILDEEFPFPPNTGKRIRSYNLLKFLVAEFQVSYLAFGSPSDRGHSALQDLGIHVVPVPRPNRKKTGLGFYGRLVKNLFSPRPFIVDEHYDLQYARALRQLTESLAYDVIIVEWTPYAHYLDFPQRIPTIVVAHNVEWRIWERYLQHADNPFKRLFVSYQLGKLRPFEVGAWKRADGVVAVSNEEAETVRHSAPQTELAIVPNGVDVSFFSSSNHRPGGEGNGNSTVVFTGSMDWRPNQDAVGYYFQNILPLLRHELPNLKSIIVGRNPPGFIRKLDGIAGMTITGEVEDVRPYFDMAEVVIVPVRIGAGSRLKILEALAMGKPVVSTTCGCEGLDLVAGRDLLVADAPQDFNRAVVRLLKDQNLRSQIGESGRILVREKYDWSKVYVSYRDLISRLATTTSRRRTLSTPPAANPPAAPCSRD